MLSLVRYLEVEKMEGKRSTLNLVRDEDLELGSSGIPKDGGVPGEASYYADVNGGEHGPCQEHGTSHGKSFKELQNGETESVGALSGYGNLLGPGDYRRLGQWNTHTDHESLSEHSERYKRSIGEITDVSLVQDERRVRSRPEASAMLTNLLGLRRDETDLHMSISARTLRPSGGKDRHSKVFTAKGPRDRRVRLSVSTAIQFYDVQDRLGYDQPSKAVEWLMKKAKDAIDELSQIPLPGIDRLVPCSSSSVYHPYGCESTEFFAQSSSSDVQLKGLGIHVQASVNSELPSSEVKASREQAVDDSDSFLNTRQTSGNNRRGELATDITMSVGDPQRKNQVQSHYLQHTGLSSFSPPPMSNTSSFLPPSAGSSSGGRQSWKCLPSQHHPAGGYLYDDPCSSLSPQQRLQGVLHASSLQYHHQLNVQQSYLTQQDLVAGGTGGALQQPGHGLLHNSQSATVLPFGMMPSGPSQNAAGAKVPYMDHFHSLKMAPEVEKPAITTGTPSVASSSTPAGRVTGSRFTGLLRSPTTEVYQKPQQQLVGHGGFPNADSSQMMQGLDELRSGKKTA